MVETTITADLVRGALEIEATDRGLLPHRLPAWARARADAQLLTAEACPAGVRLAFRTRATVVEVDLRRTTMRFRGMPPRPDGRVDLVVGGVAAGSLSTSGGTTVTVDLATGATETADGPAATLRFAGLSGRDQDVELWLPHQARTELVALRADAPVAPLPSGDRPMWVHHGSSISQGSNAGGPTGTWPALAAAAGGVDLVNLGFSGSMMLDPFVARVMRDLPADLLSLEIGINLVNGDVMRRRVLAPAVHGFLDTLRDGHPTTPLLVVGPVLCPIHEDTPGPGAPDFSDGTVRFRATGDPADVVDGPTGRLSLRAIRRELARVVAERADDPHLHLVDGLALYGEADAAEHPLPDRLHPDAAGHRLIGERFAAHAFSVPTAWSRAGPWGDRRRSVGGR
ncbi:GDSL-type esterase/lipase family protein [Actinomycetospora sp. NBRC 106375]|uniref:GDSL-type esterase/lipase family protein n=1 Tax=Actinomycetospora sp. NBRC 106375 TaxID=3032207 RepID=UPI002555E64F|nr:GDSL-type esterase/lipase family protein [Actinomycetospora sp. NBRC 106375]